VVTVRVPVGPSRLDSLSQKSSGLLGEGGICDVVGEEEYFNTLIWGNSSEDGILLTEIFLSLLFHVLLAHSQQKFVKLRLLVLLCVSVPPHVTSPKPLKGFL
jgi:hypothetical protein